MPIEHSIPISAVSQDEFHAIDRVMMGHAIAIHNDFGRLLDESIYKEELADRCRHGGLDARREVRIRIRHESFVKDYFIDLLLGGTTVVEAKTASSLNEAHRGQCINYLLLAGTRHGSLVNFRPSRLKRHFASTQLTHQIRTQFVIQEKHWPLDEGHVHLKGIVAAFCADVGLCLDLTLYREAFAALAGLTGRHLIPVLSTVRQIGHHEMHLLDHETGLAVTALARTGDYQIHLQRFLSMTPLKRIAWINLQLGQVELTSLKRQDPVLMP